MRMPGQPVVVQRPYLDEALFAKDALSKAIELDSAGNRAEAARIMQDMLDREADQLLPTEADPQLWQSVRERVHALLVQRPALLATYVSEQSALASRQLQAGELSQVERTRFLTPSGLEATLRIAQLDIEAARWHAAAIALASARTHPQAQSQMEAIESLARDLASGLAQVPARPTLRRAPQTSFERFAASLPPSTPSAPLRTLPFTPDPAAMQTFRRARLPEQGENAAWIFPTRVGDRVLINDGAGIIAADAATLAPLWRTAGGIETAPRDDQAQFFGGDQVLDDGAFVAVGQGVAVAALGRPRSGQRAGDARVVAVRIADGSELWSIDPRSLDLSGVGLGEAGAPAEMDRLADAVVRGAPIIDSDVVVLGLRRPGLTRRISSLSLLGLDLFTGEVRYVRHVGSAGTQPWTRVQLRVDGVASESGIIYRGDELGVFGAFEAHTGRPRWVRSFALGKPQDPFDAGVGRISIRAFEVASPVVTSEHVYFIEPLEQAIVQLDKATGALLATRKADSLATPRYLLQAGDMLLAIGRFSITAYPLASFASAEPVRLPAVSQDGFTGRAVVAGEDVLLPVASGLVRVPIAALAPSAVRAPALPPSSLVPEDGQAPQQAPTREFAIVPLGTSGNVLPIADSGNANDASDRGPLAHLLVADARALATHLSWERAQEQLLARAKANPADPAPVLTLLELSLRMGKAQDAPQHADVVLSLARGLRGSATRARVFRALSETLAVSRGASPPRLAGEQPPPALADKSLLLALAERLLPAADEPWQRAVAQLELALAQDGVGQGTQAIASAQNVLMDGALASVDFALQRTPGQPGAAFGEPGRTLARDIAADMLWRLREAHGPNAYAVFEEQARAALSDARAASTPQQRVRALVLLAVRFPCASASIDALELASQQVLAAGFAAGDARELLGEALSRALRAAPGQASPASDARLGTLLSRLAQASQSPLAHEPFARLLARIARDYPTLSVPAASSPEASSPEASSPAASSPAASVAPDGAATPAQALAAAPIAQLAQQWELRVQQRTDPTPLLLPRLTELSPTAASLATDALQPLRGDGLPQVLPRWELREPLARNAGSSRDVFVAYRLGTRTLGAFARSAHTPRVEQLWSRDASPEDCIVVHIGLTSTLVYWPSAEGGEGAPPGSPSPARTRAGRLEAIDNRSGLTLWQSKSITELREQSPQAQLLASKWPERLSTPLGGSVRPDDVLIAMSDAACTLVERGGFVASFSLQTGEVLWANQSPLAVVYDADVGPQSPQGPGQPRSAIALSGALPAQTPGPEGRSLGRMLAAACLLDGASGQPTTLLAGEEQVGEHARWIRALPDGGAVLATAEGLLRFAPREGSGNANVLWRTRVAAVSYSVAGSIVDGSILVLDTDLGLWRVGLRDGVLGPGAELETRDRLSIPFESIPLDTPKGRLLLHTSARGMIAHAASGTVLGVDAMQPSGRIEPALLARTLQADGSAGEPMLVTIESGVPRPTPGFRNGINASGPGSLAQGTLDPGRAIFLRAPDMTLLNHTRVGLPTQPTSLALRDGLLLVGQDGGLVVLRAMEE